MATDHYTLHWFIISIFIASCFMIAKLIRSLLRDPGLSFKKNLKWDMELINISTTTIKDALKAEGVNVGINIGKAAGAGIPSHLHVHILPRWLGDTNYMPTIGQTKVISFDLNTIYEKLVKAFKDITL